MYKKGIGYDEARSKLIGLLGNDSQIMLRNAQNGDEVRLSKTSIGKMLSNAAVQKSINNGFTREQHYAVASDIDNLFVNSIKILEYTDKNGDPNLFIHRYAAILYFSDAIAYITVRETKLIKHKYVGKRIYSTEIIEIKKFEGILNVVKKNLLANIPAPNFYDENIQKISNAAI